VWETKGGFGDQKG